MARWHDGTMARIAMIEWNPELITEVTINHGRLTVFHVSVLPNLRSLDLAHNQLASIAGCGLERCMQLEHVNLSHNLLANPTELSLFLYVVFVVVVIDSQRVRLT
mgnify:CR=1 FL=1